MYGMRWKELYKFEKAQREQLEKDLEAKRRQLEADMEIAYDDYRAEMIRDGEFFKVFRKSILIYFRT